MSYQWCRRCSQNRCSRLRHWHAWCRVCRRIRVFRGPCCRICHAQAYTLVADLFQEDTA